MYLSTILVVHLSLTIFQHSVHTIMKPEDEESSSSSSCLTMEQYEFLRKSIRPCSIHRNPGMTFADYDTTTSYARGRVLQILQENRYRTIVAGKYLPSFDLIHYCEIVPYTVDLYALQYHKESGNVVTDELIVDIRRTKYNGLTIVPYDLSMTQEQHAQHNQTANHHPSRQIIPMKDNGYRRKAFVEHANQYKKQMICSHYNIDPNRYIIIDEDKLLSKRYTKSKADIEKMLFVDRCDTMVKSRDDLYVELPA